MLVSRGHRRLDLLTDSSGPGHSCPAAGGAHTHPGHLPGSQTAQHAAHRLPALKGQRVEPFHSTGVWFRHELDDVEQLRILL